MAVNVEMFKDKDRRRWPLLLFLLMLFGVGCPALLITTPWQRTEAQSRFVPVSLHSLQNADYTQNPNPPLFPAVRLDLIWDAILDNDPTASIEVVRQTVQNILAAPIPTSSSVCVGRHVIPALRDTWIDSEDPTMTAGDDTILQLSWSGDEVKRVLLYFPVDNYLSRGTSIYRARLELHLIDPASPRPREMHFFNLKQPFAEATTNWLNQPDIYIDALPPTMLGRNIHTWDVTDSVRSWLLGHYANNGLILELPSEVDIALRYYSHEADTRTNFAVDDEDALAPRLVIDCGPGTESEPDAVADASNPTPSSPSTPEIIPPAQVPTPATPVATPTPATPPTPTPPGIIPLPTLSPTFTPLPPTETPLPTPSATPVPTPTPIPPTSSPSSTSTPVPPTSTPTPVPPQNQADVAITKSDSPDPVMSGGVLTYNLNVTNNGPDPATNVTVTDSLPGGVTLLTVSSSQGTCTGTTCNLDTLANGGSAWVTIQVTVNAASGTLANTASVSASETDSNGANNSAATTTTISALPSSDLSISKADSPDPVASGSPLAYDLTVTNNGPNDATNVTVVDTLPANVTVSGLPAFCSGTTVITCNLGILASGSNTSVSIQVTVIATSGTLNNTASVSANETDPDGTNNSATASTTVSVPTADMSITKADSPDPVDAGNNVTYTLNVTNNGPDTATGVTVVDTLLAGVTLFSAPGTCSGTTTITCNVGTLTSGAGATIDIEVTVDIGTTGTLNNTASVSASEADPDTGNNTAIALTTVNTLASADLTLSKTDAPDPVTPGSNLTYTLDVVNNGPDTATNVTVQDTLPAGVTWVSTTPSQGSCSTQTTCELGPINNGGSASVTIVVNVDAGTTGTLNNSASVVASESDPNTADNTATAATTVNTNADLSITKSDSPDPVLPADNLTYTLNVTNNGPANATGVTVVDTLPAGVTWVSTTPSQGSCSTQTTCELGTINNGGSASVTIVVNVGAGTTGTLNNSATVSGDQPDPNAANNTASTGTAVNVVADLAVTKTDSPDPVLSDNNLTYTLNVTNTGPANATGVTVADTLPAGVSLVSVNPSQGSCVGTSCNLGDLDSGNSATVTIVVTVNATSGTLSNTASVSGNESDSNMANNSVTEVTTINTDADLSITKTDSPDPVVVGDDLTYTLIITNNGPANATGVVVTDTLPATGINNIVPDAGCSENLGIVTCTIGNLAAGSSVQRTIVVGVNASAGSTLTNQAEVSGDQPDPNTANNTASTTTIAAAPGTADLAVTKTVDIPAPAEGSTIVYEITVTNNGPLVIVTSVVVSDVLPAGVTYVADSGGGDYDPGTGVWDVGNLNSGSSATLFITATVDAGTGGTTIDNTATGSASQVDPDSSNNSATATITVAAPLVDLALSGLVDNPNPAENDTVVYTVGVTNNGPDNATNVVIQNVLPGGITYVGANATQGGYVQGTGLWTVGDLNNTASASLLITTTVDAGTAGSTINNTASVNSVDQTDSNPGNDSVTVPITVTSLCNSPSITLTAVADAYIRSNNNNPTGGDTILQIRPDSANPIFRSLVQFDLLGIPSVSCAELWIYEETTTSGQTVNVHPLTESWTEGDVNWDDRTAADLWSTPGGVYGAGAATFAPDTTGVRVLDLTALAQFWVGNPTQNFGVLLRSTTTGDNGAVTFSSRESGNPPPRLVIEY